MDTNYFFYIVNSSSTSSLTIKKIKSGLQLTACIPLFVLEAVNFFSIPVISNGFNERLGLNLLSVQRRRKR